MPISKNQEPQLENVKTDAELKVHNNFESHFELKRSYFDSGVTRSYSFRKKQLEALREAILKSESQIFLALKNDLKKSDTESYLTEYGIVLSEIDQTLKNLHRWMRPVRKFAPLFVEPSSSKLHFEPKGVVLIIAPWNYPFYLTITPLIGAMAAGNCAVIKPSEEAPHTAHIIEELIHSTFEKNFVSVVQGEGHKVVPQLMEDHLFNHIFFTGSGRVGSIIARTAAEKLTPTTLELGGKSPAIVHASADLKVSAKRIVWGKYTNAGQTCVAPDYVLVDPAICDDFITELKRAILQFYGENPQKSADYPRLINRKRFDAILPYLDQGTLVHGGNCDPDDLFIEPTIILQPGMTDSVMKEEIFGPVLPILTFNSMEDASSIIRKNRYPLAAYFFGTDRKAIRYFKQNIQFGGGCINDTLLHLANPNLPFGGLMGSGNGNYHGRHTFECFSHAKSVLHGRTWIDPPLRYPPYSQSKLKWLRKLF